MDLALNNLQRLMCHKSQPTKPNVGMLKKETDNTLGRCLAVPTNVKYKKLHSVELL